MTTLEVRLALLRAHAAQRPMLFIEDLHWVDPSTLGLLTLLIAEDPTDRIPTLLTARPEFHPTWGCWTHVTSLTRERLSSIQVEQMIDRVTGGSACRLRSGKRIV